MGEKGPGAVSKCQVCTYSCMRWDRVKGFNYLYTVQAGSTRKVMSPTSYLPPDLNGSDIQPQAQWHWYGTDLAFEWNGKSSRERGDWQREQGERGGGGVLREYRWALCHRSRMWTRWWHGNVQLIRARLCHVLRFLWDAALAIQTRHACHRKDRLKPEHY